MKQHKKSFLSFTVVLAALALLALSACDAERDPHFWAKTFDYSEGTQISHAMKPTADGGYILAGTVSINRFEEMDLGDVWAAKLDSEGTIEWQKTYSGSHVEIGIDGMDVVLSSDGGYLLTCRSNSFSDDYSPWLIKIDNRGNIQWEKIYRDDNYTTTKAAVATSDGGYALLLGASNNVVDPETGENVIKTNEVELMKLTSDGDIQWIKSFLFNDGTEFQDIEALAVTPEGGYLVSGAIVPVEAEGVNDIYRDAVLMLLDSSGNLVWKRELSGYRVFNSFNAVTITNDGIFVAGSTSVPESIGNGDFLLARFSLNGDLLWQKKFDINNSGDDEFVSLYASGSTLVAAGTTSGYDASDAVALSFSAGGTTSWAKAYDAERAEAKEIYKSALGYAIVGYNGNGLLISVDNSGNIPHGEKRIRNFTPAFETTGFTLSDRDMVEGTTTRTVESTRAVIKYLTLSVENL